MEILNILIIVSILSVVLFNFNQRLFVLLNILIMTKFIIAQNYFPLLLFPVVMFISSLRSDFSNFNLNKIRNNKFLAIIKTVLTSIILMTVLWKYTYLGKASIVITEKELGAVLAFLIVLITCGGVIKFNDNDTSTN